MATFLFSIQRKLHSFGNIMLKKKIIPPSSQQHTATVIFFHGSGDTGDNLVEWVRYLLGRDMQFPHIKLIYPTAPVQPYTPLDGSLSTVWFDRKAISIDVRESRSSMAKIYHEVNELIKEEITLGIPIERIVVGGFSMGGTLAMHTGFHINQNVAGVFVCSAFLNRGSIVYEGLTNLVNSKNYKLPELLMTHGDRDTMVPIPWGQETYDELTKLGVKGDFLTLRHTMHELKIDQLKKIEKWIKELLPPLEKDASDFLQNKL